MSEVQRWLPPSALESAEAVVPIGECLAEWSGLWLASAAATPYGAWRQWAGDPLAASGEVLECEAGGMRIHPEPETALLLAGAMLGQSLSGQSLRGGDRMVIDHLAARALDDLARRLGETAAGFAPAPPASARDCYRLDVRLRGRTLLTVEAGRDCAAAMAIARAGPPRKRSGPSPRHEAVQAQAIGIAALLGRNRLPLSDLEKLGVGDVLPLATGSEAPLDLRVGTSRIPASARLALQGEHFTLHIERPASEWQIARN